MLVEVLAQPPHRDDVTIIFNLLREVITARKLVFD